jgi:glyoxylase-like metal-dependent hydrolase (beta-lactamase superfamily II)
MGANHSPGTAIAAASLMQAEQIARGVYRLRTLMVNVYFVADTESPRRWMLVDTGMRGYAGVIRREARRVFGTRPAAIVLTHGHFDHIGGLPRLADVWGVPIYAHPLELPYLTGRSPYPPPDPTVGGGTQSWISPLYPRGPIDLDTRVHMLPQGGGVPGFTEWQWLWTDGHTPGHVSLFREHDRTLIAGDAVVTTRQESTMNVLLQREVVWRPPAYYTSDWNAARRSVEILARLAPEVLATGHGHALRGPAMREALSALADRFDEAMPSSGRYVPYPAVADERGVVHVPPRPGIAITPANIAIGAAAVAAGVAVVAIAIKSEVGSLKSEV